MLRLARLRPLAKAINGWTYFPRVYSSTESSPPAAAAPSHDDQLNEILAGISTPSLQRQSNVRPWTGTEQDLAPQSDTTITQLDGYSFTEFTDPKFGDSTYTTRSYDRFLNAYPALKHHVDTQKLHARLKYDEVYLKDHAYEPKTVFKFKKVVTKNYRTISRSWPMVHLNSFKYGNDHFLDVMYDDIEGKYDWNNQLAYPDGSINLFCGTSSKAGPIDVKGDPLALTYDDSLHNSDTIKPLRIAIPKSEADARFPRRFEKEQEIKRAKAAKEREELELKLLAERATVPRTAEFETESQEDARKQAEKELAQKKEAKIRQEIIEKYQAAKDRYVPDNLDETIKERRDRWAWETKEDVRRPWRTMANRGIHRSWDERVLYDPVTMVRLVSFSARGTMIERYYYRDEITPENTEITTSKSDVDQDPDFNPVTGVLEYPESNDWRLEKTAAPNPDSMPAYCPKDADVFEKARHKVVTELLPNREKGKGAKEDGKVEYNTKELRKDLLDEGVLPDSVRETMLATFKELVEEGSLKQEDEWVYYNDYVRLTAKAMSRARAEEYRKNKLHSTNAELPGMFHVSPTYYFKYIKLNLKEGWIRFYVGEHNRADKSGETNTTTNFTVQAGEETNPMKYPFTWRYSEYQLPEEEITAMRKVQWPPSLIPPATSSQQVGDGSPADQLAQYFEKSYLQFGHDVRFNPAECFSPEHDNLEEPNFKYVRSVGSNASDVQFIPDPGQLDLSTRTALTPEERAAEDVRLRGVIRRAASEAMDRETESMASAFANQVTAHELYREKNAEELDEVTHGHSQMWLYDEYPGFDPDLVPAYKFTSPAMHFRQRGDIVFAYDSAGKVTQEYQGYRLKTSHNKIRIVRLPSHPQARVSYYDEKGNVVRTEEHPLPNIDYSLPHDRFRDRAGRSAWAFTSDAHAEIAIAQGLPSKRAREIQKAEQGKAEALADALRELDSASEEGEEVEERETEKDEDDRSR